MGLYSVISHATSKMTRGDTTNPRTLGKWRKRVLGIAQDLEKSHDIVKQQKLETVVADVAERFASAETSQEESTSQITPKIYQKRKEILSEGDKTLDAIQAPAKGHLDEMQQAMSRDERALGSILEDLTQADDGLLKEVSELVSNTERTEESKMSGMTSVGNPESRSPTSASSRTHILGNKERAYEQFEEKLAQYKQGKRAPSIMIGISDMESENGEPIAHFIPFDHTFCALADSVTNFDSNSSLPDFWSKEVDPTRNRITKSGVWWEWQDPNKKVIDAINKEGHIAIETVCKDVEYVVVLVKKGDSENGMPIEMPRKCRQRAFQHLQQQFPDHVVSQVLRLQEGVDARDVWFDSRYFPHKTNPLFVELKLGAELAQPTSEVVGEADLTTPEIDKGKGRAITGDQ